MDPGEQTIDGKPAMKPWYEITEEEAQACLDNTTWGAADIGYFRGGGFSSTFNTKGGMPITMSRINIIKGLGPVLQIAEGHTIELPEEVHHHPDRTDQSHLAHHLVCTQADRRRELQGCLFGDGQLGSQSWSLLLRTSWFTADGPGCHAPDPGLHAQCS